MAGALRSLGVEAGDRLALLGRNGLRQAELIRAGYWIGVVSVPIDFRLVPVQIRAILDEVSPRLLAVEDHWARHIPDSVFAGRRAAVLSIGRDHGGWLGGPVYEELHDASPEEDGGLCGEDADALLLYTGGTMGQAEGVRLTHRNIVTNGLQLVGPYCVAEDDVMLHVAPMFHSADLIRTPFSLSGAVHAFLPDLTPDSFLNAVEESRATFTMLSPTPLIRIVR